MTVYIGDWIRWGVTIPFVIYHGSVTWFIFYMMVIRKNKMYNSHFYILYIMISIADQATIINNALVHKAIRIDAWKPWFFEHPEWDTVLWACSGYLIYFQSILHTSIAVNRSWSSVSILAKRNSVILPRIGKFAICLLPFIALAIVSPRFAGHSYYIYTSDCELTSTYKELYVQQYHAIAGPSVVLSTSCLSFILAILTIIRYRKLLKQYNTISSSMKQDLLLFTQALLMLTFELALAAFYVMRLIGLANKYTNLLAFAADYFDYVTDALSLCNPIALLIVCKFIQKDYLDFYLRRTTTDFVAVSVISNTSRSIKVATTIS